MFPKGVCLPARRHGEPQVFRRKKSNKTEECLPSRYVRLYLQLLLTQLRHLSTRLRREKLHA